MDKLQFLPGLNAPSEPASRQKSCNACVRSKRKCDKRAPVCSRCAERDEPCVYKRRRLAYPGQAEIGAYEVQDHEFLFPLALGESEKGEANRSGLAPLNGSMDLNYENSAAVSSPTSFPFSGLSPFDIDFLDFSDTHPSEGNTQSAHITTGINSGTRDHVDVAAITSPCPKDTFLNATSSNDPMWLTHNQPALEVERPGTPVSEEIQATYEKMGDLCVSSC